MILSSVGLWDCRVFANRWWRLRCCYLVNLEFERRKRKLGPRCMKVLDIRQSNSSWEKMRFYWWSSQTLCISFWWSSRWYLSCAWCCRQLGSLWTAEVDPASENYSRTRCLRSEHSCSGQPLGTGGPCRFHSPSRGHHLGSERTWPQSA